MDIDTKKLEFKQSIEGRLVDFSKDSLAVRIQTSAVSLAVGFSVGLSHGIGNTEFPLLRELHTNMMYYSVGIQSLLGVGSGFWGVVSEGEEGIKERVNSDLSHVSKDLMNTYVTTYALSDGVKKGIFRGVEGAIEVTAGYLLGYAVAAVSR